MSVPCLSAEQVFGSEGMHYVGGTQRPYQPEHRGSGASFRHSATDETCVLFGMIWNAGADRDLPTQDCNITFLDEAGIGHAIGENAFPRASQAEADLCASGAPGDACRSCQCGACAKPLIKCATDVDCKPILDCIQDATQDCTEVVDTHSSAVGLLFQASSCVEASGCDASCPE